MKILKENLSQNDLIKYYETIEEKYLEFNEAIRDMQYECELNKLNTLKTDCSLLYTYSVDLYKYIEEIKDDIEYMFKRDEEEY